MGPMMVQPVAASLYRTLTGLNLHDLDDSCAQHPWGSWPVPGWLVAVFLGREYREETKRKRQVFLTREVEKLRDN